MLCNHVGVILEPYYTEVKFSNGHISVYVMETQSFHKYFRKIEISIGKQNFVTKIQYVCTVNRGVMRHS